jgi:uncharacterized protein (UPF0147 family)
MNDDAMAVITMLRDPHTIRSRAQAILKLAKQDKLEYFALNNEKMAATASFVIDIIQEQYPDLNIPYHSRWRHFEAGGVDRIKPLRLLPSNEQGKILYELVIISVFLDAGAGKYWHYKEPETGAEYTRSEGLALASLALYQKGAFSAKPHAPHRVDAKRLIELTEYDLGQGFQVTPDNPLEGISGRLTLLNQLGLALKNNPQYFGTEGRLGNFYTYISSLKNNHAISAIQIFQAVINAFNEVWPTRLSLNGIALGDVWKHKALKTDELGSEYIPFHKLSQWLTYSLIEPLEQTGIKVTALDALTGLPEYRNGGLFIDSGLLRVKNTNLLHQAHDPSSEFIVEWRALTVALLDELSGIIRKKLHKNEDELPLAKILQGGTWQAGRRIANQLRPEGEPPIQIISDGTVF